MIFKKIFHKILHPRSLHVYSGEGLELELKKADKNKRYTMYLHGTICITKSITVPENINILGRSNIFTFLDETLTIEGEK